MSTTAIPINLSVAAWTQAQTQAISPFLPTSSPASSQWSNCIDDLKRIRRYRDNWDQLGSPAADPTIVDAAIAFVIAMRAENRDFPPLRASLSSDGSVCIEWQSSGLYREAEVSAPDRIEWVESLRGRPTQHWVEHLPMEERSDGWRGVGEQTVGAVG